MLTRLRPVMCGGAMLAILMMGLSKLLDLPGFSRIVRVWDVLPSATVPFAAVLVPVAEVAVAGLWLVGVWRMGCAALATILLAAFTVAYGVVWARGAPPPCGCFGVLATHLHQVDSAGWVLARNLLLGGALITGMRPVSRAQSDCAPDTEHGSCKAPRSRAFTLIELILVVALVGVLIALLSPTLGRVRESGREAKSLANLRSHAIIFSVYTSDYRDFVTLQPSASDPNRNRLALSGGAW